MKVVIGSVLLVAFVALAFVWRGIARDRRMTAADELRLRELGEKHAREDAEAARAALRKRLGRE